MNRVEASRTFKTKWFAKAARAAGIGDAELCKAIEQVKLGQCDDLGGGVYKKRLNENRERSIVLAKGGKNWFYAFLFSKKDRQNIDSDELKSFKDLADIYASKSDQDIDKELRANELKEICHGKKI